MFDHDVDERLPVVQAGAHQHIAVPMGQLLVDEVAAARQGRDHHGIPRSSGRDPRLRQPPAGSAICALWVPGMQRSLPFHRCFQNSPGLRSIGVEQCRHVAMSVICRYLRRRVGGGCRARHSGQSWAPSGSVIAAGMKAAPQVAA